MNNRWSLKNKKALITGGTRGIGKAIAEEFISLGSDVFIISRNKTEIDNTINDLKKMVDRIESIHIESVQIEGLHIDVTKMSDREKLFDKISGLWGKLDILVNNAGFNNRIKTLDVRGKDYNELMELNVNSVFEMCRLFHPLLKKSEDSSIVNISSVAGFTSVHSGSVYAMTKAAITQLSRYLSVEWAGDNIRVNAIAPWYIRTPLTEPVLSVKSNLEKILLRTPMNRVGNPEEVAAAATFLSMPAASYITGECIAIDGGFLKMGF